MKRLAIISTIAAALTIGVTSCDLDLRPVGTIDPSNALQSLSDAQLSVTDITSPSGAVCPAT